MVLLSLCLCVCLVPMIAGRAREPLQIEASPLQTGRVQTEAPVVRVSGTADFFGQEEAVGGSAGTVQQATTTPSPYKTVAVVFEVGNVSAWRSALSKVETDVTVDKMVDEVADLRNLHAWLRAQQAGIYSFCCVDTGQQMLSLFAIVLLLVCLQVAVVALDPFDMPTMTVLEFADPTKEFAGFQGVNFRGAVGDAFDRNTGSDGLPYMATTTPSPYIDAKFDPVGQNVPPFDYSKLALANAANPEVAAFVGMPSFKTNETAYPSIILLRKVLNGLTAAATQAANLALV